MFRFITKSASLISLTATVCVFSALISAYYIVNNKRSAPSEQEAVISVAREPQAGPYQPAEEGIRKDIVSTPLGKISLPLRLVGIYEHSGEKVACIEDIALLNTGYYKIGDKIRGATLIQILSGGAVLLKDGRRIILAFNKSYNWRARGEWIDTLTHDRFIVSRGRLNKKILGVNQLLDEIVVVPNISNIGIDGFCISSLKKGGVINQAGFQKGDIIKGVNGLRMNSLKKPLKAYVLLRRLVDVEEDPIVKIELERNNKMRMFTYRILQK